MGMGHKLSSKIKTEQRFHLKSSITELLSEHKVNIYLFIYVLIYFLGGSF